LPGDDGRRKAAMVNQRLSGLLPSIE
jgi:hypothetical protein